MKVTYLIRNVLLLFCSIITPPAMAVGSTDLPKIKGSVLIAEDRSDYAEGVFFVAKNEKSDRVVERFKEGKSTRLVYLLEEGQSPLFALRNYQEAFAKLGEVTEIYSCKPGKCWKYLTTNHVWARDSGRQIKSNTDSIKLNSFLGGSLFQGGQSYWTGIIKSDDSTYTVSVHSVVRSDYAQGQRRGDLGIKTGQAIVYLQVIEYSDFKSDLEYITASEIQSEISQSGHVALSGLYFDTGSDQLTAESAPALGEISKALKASPELKFYVVGHTDNVGSVTSNQDLSARRAKSVAVNLVKDYGIDSERFVPIGVGLAAPVTSNKTEEGKALNRRVELVER